MCAVLPMHNLLLGTAKYVTELWKTRSILTCKDFLDIQEKVNSCVSPPDIGGIPSKISLGFSGFSTDQWKSWVLIVCSKGCITSRERMYYHGEITNVGTHSLWKLPSFCVVDQFLKTSHKRQVFILEILKNVNRIVWKWSMYNEYSFTRSSDRMYKEIWAGILLVFSIWKIKGDTRWLSITQIIVICRFNSWESFWTVTTCEAFHL